MKRFLQHWLGINELHELHDLNKNRMNDHIARIEDLKIRIKYLEQENRELISFISSVFPNYYHLNYAYQKHRDFIKDLKNQHYKDGLISKVIIEKEDELREKLKRAIADNELNIKQICLEVSEELFNKLINEKFPAPEEFKEENQKD